jgi:nicotinamidase-related amidase
MLPLSTQEPLTRDNAVTIFIDLQLGAIGSIQSMDRQELTQNAIALAKVCTILQLPVIIAAADIPGDRGTVLPELVEQLPNATHIKHATNNSWETPEFVEKIQQLGRKHLVMAGLATDVGLCLPAISAVTAGYQVSAIVDVSGTLNQRIERAAWMRMAQAGVILTSWTGFTGEIQHNYTQPPGSELLKIIGESSHFKPNAISIPSP